ncbi:hypothetical protein ACHQM5_005971 [Ranunculus cassubicifolius]
MNPNFSVPGTEYQPPKILIPEQWSEAAFNITNESITTVPPISFICGPKNSGKTTFSRHLLNTLLQRYDKVAYLDTDVGQPEFTAPGCLSLSIFDKPPDLAVTYIRTPERCIFFGDISSKRDPETYLKNIFSLYDYYHAQYYMSNESKSGNPGKPMLPLVINTPGWVKGIGYELLVSMLRYISPTHVIQVRITAQSKNLPSGAFWLDEEKRENEGLNLIEIYAAREDSYRHSVLTLKDAKLIRDLRIKAYFRQCFPENMEFSFKELAYALCSHPPYEVPISSVKITHLYGQVPSSEIYRGLNASIVALAVSSTKSTDGEPSTPWCVGLGIVRAIDLSKDLLYILTPVPQRILAKVDLLLQGFIEIPTGLLQEQGCRSPYMSANVLPYKC